MNLLLTAIFGVNIYGTVDRIEGDFACIEWSDGSFSDMPTSIINFQPKEGESIRVRVLPSSDVTVFNVRSFSPIFGN